MKLFNKILKLNINEKDICRSHRIGKKTEGSRNTRSNKKKSRPVIVKFISYSDRKDVFFNKRKLKGKDISITESLTVSRYALYRKCMDKYGMVNVWTLDGRIFCVDENDDVHVVTCDENLR